MAAQKYTFEEKKEFIQEYLKETKSHEPLNASKLATWCNKHYGLAGPQELRYLDFRRSQDIRDYIDAFNEKIANTVVFPDGTIKVVSNQLIDPDWFLKKCTSKDKMLDAIQQANTRFEEIVAMNHEFENKLKKINKASASLREEVVAQAAETKKEAAEIEATRKACKKAVAAARKAEKAEKAKNKALLSYIETYMYDPILTQHFADFLGVIETKADKGITLPESFKPLVTSEDKRTFGEAIEQYKGIVNIEVPDEDEDMEDEEEKASDVEIEETPTVLSSAQADALMELDELLGGLL